MKLYYKSTIYEIFTEDITHVGLVVVFVEIQCCCLFLLLLFVNNQIVLVTRVGEAGSWSPIIWFRLVQSVGSICLGRRHIGVTYYLMIPPDS